MEEEQYITRSRKSSKKIITLMKRPGRMISVSLWQACGGRRGGGEAKVTLYTDFHRFPRHINLSLIKLVWALILQNC